MNEFAARVQQLNVQRAMDALRANRMEPFYLERADQVRSFVQQLLPAGCTVACGGSMTLAETGVTALLEEGGYNYLDRSRTDRKDWTELFRRSFSADWYLTSANAITLNGELFNVDGNANRVAAIAFGPSHVLVIAGVNKLVRDLDAAEERVRTLAAPANAMRLSCQTPCAVTGQCQDCHSPGRICCDTLICRQQRDPDRIKVLLVGEPLGL